MTEPVIKRQPTLRQLEARAVRARKALSDAQERHRKATSALHDAVGLYCAAVALLDAVRVAGTAGNGAGLLPAPPPADETLLPGIEEED